MISNLHVNFSYSYYDQIIAYLYKQTILKPSHTQIDTKSPFQKLNTKKLFKTYLELLYYN